MVAGRGGVGRISLWLTIQDWILSHLGLTAILVVFIVAVGLIWPLSDAMGKARPALRPARLGHWRRQDTVPLDAACFLWFGLEPPRRPEQVEAWLQRNASLRVMRRHLQEFAGTADGAADIPVEDLYTYAEARERLRGERIPTFLINRFPVARQSAVQSSDLQ